jgi:hypothetical protein
MLFITARKRVDLGFEIFWSGLQYTGLFMVLIRKATGIKININNLVFKLLSSCLSLLATFAMKEATAYINSPNQIRARVFSTLLPQKNFGPV